MATATRLPACSQCLKCNIHPDLVAILKAIWHILQKADTLYVTALYQHRQVQQKAWPRD
jgi:hypothetical protein